MTIEKKTILKDKLPVSLHGLVDLAFNLWWTWQPDGRELFQRLDPPLWVSTRHNPIRILRDISKDRIDQMASHHNWLSLYHKIMDKFEGHRKRDAELWFRRTYPQHSTKTIAYLSMEYGIHNSLPIYSGGLGILAGDHLKESSDLGIPVIAVGFLYEEGYFTQKIPRDGWQEAFYHQADFNDFPIEELIDPETNNPLILSIDINDDVVWVKIWQVNVGRVKLYLLDSNIDDNPSYYRDLTDRLYGGSSELRIKQEMVLGIGAVRLFKRLGIEPSVWHLNEGHCAFSSIERIYQDLLNGSNFDDALQLVRKNTIFTTHTPVPAGHDMFDFSLVRQNFSRVYIKEFGEEDFLSLGSYDIGYGTRFNMTVLAFRTSSRFNAVSKLHRKTSEKMFLPLWEELRSKNTDFEPITYVTNGVHVPSYTTSIYQQFFTQIDKEWPQKYDLPEYWSKDGQMLARLTDKEIWQRHVSIKKRTITRIRERARNQIKNKVWDSQLALQNGALLDPDTLTIGFARRFATYKRATLIFHDINRLAKMLNDKYRPIQIIFAGKAHPADDAGKKLIKEVIQFTQDTDLGHRIAFIENYDLVSAKMLYEGVDIWLNTPLRPNEASGTSGMKTSVNFIPNVSI
ncbi:MAG: alpha-glucan family phosphorylase, partial [Candidatus Hodarchaeales archaeon]